MPKVSVIVPVYNVEPYLRRCLDSIIAQTFTDWECILVDDGSTDRSGRICDEYAEKEKRIIVIHQNNSGVSKARNVGLNIAVGRWVSFIDADDEIELNFLTSSYNETADLIIKGWVSSSNERLEVINESLIETSQLKSFYSNNIDKYVLRVPWAKLFKSEIIRENDISFDVRYKIGEDNLFVLDYLNHTSNIIVENNANYIYTLPIGIKYANTIQQSLLYIEDFEKKYSRLEVTNEALAYMKLNLYYLLVRDITFGNKVLWYTNSYTYLLYRHCRNRFRKKICMYYEMGHFLSSLLPQRWANQYCELT